jgi:hypothetical protein
MPKGSISWGTLQPNAEDGLADFVALREPSPFEGPS